MRYLTALTPPNSPTMQYKTGKARAAGSLRMLSRILCKLTAPGKVEDSKISNDEHEHECRSYFDFKTFFKNGRTRTLASKSPISRFTSPVTPSASQEEENGKIYEEEVMYVHRKHLENSKYIKPLVLSAGSGSDFSTSDCSLYKCITLGQCTSKKCPFSRDPEIWTNRYRQLGKRYHPEQGSLTDLQKRRQHCASLLPQNHLYTMRDRFAYNLGQSMRTQDPLSRKWLKRWMWFRKFRQMELDHTDVLLDGKIQRLPRNTAMNALQDQLTSTTPEIQAMRSTTTIAGLESMGIFPKLDALSSLGLTKDLSKGLTNDAEARKHYTVETVIIMLQASVPIIVDLFLQEKAKRPQYTMRQMYDSFIKKVQRWVGGALDEKYNGKYDELTAREVFLDFIRNGGKEVLWHEICVFDSNIFSPLKLNTNGNKRERRPPPQKRERDREQPQKRVRVPEEKVILMPVAWERTAEGRRMMREREKKEKQRELGVLKERKEKEHMESVAECTPESESEPESEWRYCDGSTVRHLTDEEANWRLWRSVCW